MVMTQWSDVLEVIGAIFAGVSALLVMVVYLTRSAGTGWWVPALAGAGAFWSANLVISMTPIAAGYRSALSIPYVPMLVEAAAGGLVVAGALAFVLVRYRERVPGAGQVRKALLLGVGALVLLTVLVEVPSKLRSDLADPGHWLLMATVFNAVRILALAVTIGLVTRPRRTRGDRHRPRRRQEAES